jgi:hypothetical protein
MEEKHRKTLLGLHLVVGYSGKVQFDVVLSIIQEYSIIQKLRAIIGDKSSTNNTLC